MHMQAHGITMAVELVVLLAPVFSGNRHSFRFGVPFAEIDDKVVRTTDYSGVLQARTRTFFMHLPIP